MNCPAEMGVSRGQVAGLWVPSSRLPAPQAVRGEGTMEDVAPLAKGGTSAVGAWGVW